MDFSAAVELFFVSRAPRKDSVNTTAAYRRDLVAVARLIARQRGCELADVDCDVLSVSVLRSAFAEFSRDRAKSSIQRAWSVWNAFFSFLVGEGLVAGNPMSGVGRPKAERPLPKPLRGEDTADRLLEALMSGVRGGRNPWPQRDVAVVAVLLLTGVRSGELLGLRAGDVAGRAGERRLVIRGGKGGADRVVPVEVPLEVLLEEYLVSRRGRFPRARWPLAPGEALFVDHKGEALTRNQLQYLVRQCYRFAGVGDAVHRGALVHALRHTFATRVGASGASAIEVMELLGHRSLGASQGYLGVTGRELRDAARANPGYGVLGRLVSGRSGGEDVADGRDGVAGGGDER